MLFLAILLFLMGILLWIVDGGPILVVLSVVCLCYWMIRREQRSAERQRIGSEIEAQRKGC